MAKILLVEDDAEFTSRVRDWFAAEGHVFESVNNGEDGLQLLANFAFDVVLLDWNLPGMAGVDVCKQFRKLGGMSYVIFLTGKSDVDSKELALDLGGDDYLTKPFDLRELSARIRTLLRRPPGYLKEELKIGSLTLDVRTKIAADGDRSVQLMPKESALLEYLMRHPNRAHGAKDLLKAVWPSGNEATTDTVRSWMRILRGKLAEVGHESLIKTISRSGYLIELDEGAGER